MTEKAMSCGELRHQATVFRELTTLERQWGDIRCITADYLFAKYGGDRSSWSSRLTQMVTSGHLKGAPATTRNPATGRQRKVKEFHLTDEGRAEAKRLRREQVAAEKADRKHREAMTDLYSGVARAVQTLAGYGGYEDIGQLWAEFSTDFLFPPQLDEFGFSHQRLAEAKRLIDWLITWNEEGRP